MIDYQKVNCANVYLRDTLAGVLERHSSDRYSFQYLTEYLTSPRPSPIACAFPLRTEPYFSRYLHPFFDNLILEGWLLSYAEKIFHIDKKNRFAILMAIGRSTVGAVSIRPLNLRRQEYLELEIEKGNSYPTRLDEIEFLNSGGFCPSCLNRSPQNKIFHPKCSSALFGTSRKLKIELDADRPLDTFSRTIYGGSISGAQRKGLFVLDSGIIRPNSLDSEYILKPEGDYPELPANEHLTMAIAKKIGFRTPPFVLLQIPSLGFIYLVKRFDRLNGIPKRMEDMAQVLGGLSEDKYESSYERIAKAIQSHAVSFPLDLDDFFRRLLYCFLTANGDMHLKNWSLLEKDDFQGNLELSPCYDFLNTRLPIPREQLDIGLSLLGKKKNLQRSYFYKFGLQILGIEKKRMEKIFAEIPSWHQVANDFILRSYLSEKSKKKYRDLVQERFQVLMKD
jgi:serine/threonine-protein kinase HipA